MMLVPTPTVEKVSAVARSRESMMTRMAEAVPMGEAP